MSCEECGRPLCYCGLCHHCTVVQLERDRDFDDDELGTDPEDDFDA